MINIVVQKFKYFLIVLLRYLFTLVVWKQENIIVFVSHDNSGSNAALLYKMVPNSIKGNYKLVFIQNYNSGSFSKKIKDLLLIARAKIIVSTHGVHKIRSNQVLIWAWHGFPVKRLGLWDKLEKETYRTFKRRKLLNEVDCILSYSELCSVIENSRRGITGNKYFITGAPRNDLLFSSEGSKIVRSLFNISENIEHIIIYAPTYRASKGRLDGKPLDHKDLSFGEFGKQLTAHRCALIIKPHAKEIDIYEERLKKELNYNVYILTDKLLAANNIDFYEVLNAADILITDYSSIYIDYLLLDRPIIFYQPDAEYYNNKRGLMLGLSDWWFPGNRVETQKDLLDAILECIGGNDLYQHERETVKYMTHKYFDNNSNSRVWKLIDEKYLN